VPETEPRKTRKTYNVPGHAHELTFSVHRRGMHLLQPGIAEAFLDNLVRTSDELRFDIWAYVLMPEHVHLLIWPREEPYDISTILRELKVPVAQKAFELHPDLRKLLAVPRKGRPPETRFWQPGGGYDRNMFTPKVIEAAIEYIHMNPVRRGFVEAATDWPWSSARNYAGLQGEIPVVLYSWQS